MINKMMFLKICCSEWVNENRDKRELSVCRELGMDILVMAKGTSGDRGRKDEIDGYEVRRLSTRPLGNKFPNLINRAISIISWASYAKKVNANIISGHDLGALTIAWFSTMFMPKEKKPKLVYDSHELEIGRNARRNRVTTWIITYWERLMIKSCSLIIVVNDSIADEMQRIHKLKERPVVVRNMPKKWDIDEKVCRKKREELLDEIGGVRLLVMYHGAISRGRGIEDLIDVALHFDCVGLVILGEASDKEFYHSLIDKIQFMKNVIMHHAVPMSELWKYVGAADVGMVNISPVTKSYYFALPNKLFENIQAMTPVIVSDLPELRGIVEKYGVGMICEADSSKSIELCLKKIMENEFLLKKYKENAKKAKEELCWEKESQILIKAYKAL